MINTHHFSSFFSSFVDCESLPSYSLSFLSSFLPTFFSFLLQHFHSSHSVHHHRLFFNSCFFSYSFLKVLCIVSRLHFVNFSLVTRAFTCVSCTLNNRLSYSFIHSSKPSSSFSCSSSSYVMCVWLHFSVPCAPVCQLFTFVKLFVSASARFRSRPLFAARTWSAESWAAVPDNDSQMALRRHRPARPARLGRFPSSFHRFTFFLVLAAFVNFTLIGFVHAQGMSLCFCFSILFTSLFIIQTMMEQHRFFSSLQCCWF